MRQTIANLERDLEKVLLAYEDKEITTAEIVGTLTVVASRRAMRANLAAEVSFLRDLLEIPSEAVSGPPVGDTIQIERKDETMET